MAVGGNTDQGLSRGRLTAAGLEVLQEQGLDGLTMRTLADRLGVKAASLYWHVRDRRELIELLATSLLAQVEPSAPDGAATMNESWRPEVVAAAASLSSMLQRYRDARRLLLEVPAAVEESAVFIRLRRILEGAGLAPAQAVEAARMIAFHAILDSGRETAASTGVQAPGRPAVLIVDTGTRGVTVKVSAGGDELATARREKTAPAGISIAGDTVTVRRLRGIGRADVELNPGRAWTVHVKGSTLSTKLDLSGLDIREVYVDGGASRLDCILPLPRGVVPVHLSGGVVGARLHRPANAAVHAEVSPGAMRVHLDRRSILMAATETHWGSGGGAAAPDRYELEISGGAIQVTLDDDVPPAASAQAAADEAGLRGPLGAPAPSAATASAEGGSFALELMLDGVERAISLRGRPD
jgi:TetR/AcrR family tetracycline transcriptional repressor